MTRLPECPPPRVALETTLILHGVPRAGAKKLATSLATIVRAEGAEPALVGVLDGRAIVGMTDAELDRMLAAPAANIPKLNSANLGATLHARGSGATTVSSTMEIACRAGLSVFATGGLGGVHKPEGGLGAGSKWTFDVSADLVAFTRWPVAVVTSGVKSILDVAATREVLETLGIPVVGYRTDDFPAFYMRKCHDQRAGRVDARFDDIAELASYVRAELARSGRGIVVCNPIPVSSELAPADWARWLAEAESKARAAGASGRDVTPAVLGALHEFSLGATLKANITLVEDNARVAAAIARAMADLPAGPRRS